MPARKKDAEHSKKYNEFREKLERLHQKEVESPGEEHGMQGIYEPAYDNITSEIIYYGSKAGVDFVRIITSEINDEPNYIREQLIKALGSIGRRRSETIEASVKALMECFEDSDFGIRMYASDSMAEMAKRSPDKVIPDLIIGLQSSDNLVREWSAETIGKIAKSDPTLVIDSIPHLMPLLEDPDVGPAINAAEALETVSKKSLQYFEKYTEQMRPAVNHYHQSVSDAIKRILTRLGKLEESSGRSKASSIRKGRTYKKIEAVPEVESDYVFILMAFKEDPLLEDVVDTVKGICSSLKLRAERVDDIQHFGRITDKIIERIKASRILIADLSYERPNVYYELGFAHGLNRDVILLAKEETELHFDIKDFNVLFYRNIKELSSKLKKRLHVALGIPE